MRTVMRRCVLSAQGISARRAVSGLRQGVADYAGVLAVPGARAFFLAAVPARVGVAMTGLGLIWLVRWGTGSYGAAGVVSGAFVVTSALSAPVLGRWMARFGQARVLLPCVAVHALAVAALVGLVAAHCPLWLIAVVGIVAGGALPQIGSLTATRWSVLLAGRSGLSTAFALESLSNELAYLFGPALVGTVSALVAPPAGAVLAGGLVVAGSVGLAAQRRTEPSLVGTEPPVAERAGGRLVSAGFGVLLVVSLAIGMFFGAMQVSVTAFAVRHGVGGSAGLLYALLSVTSLLAGFAYGARNWRSSPARQLGVALLVLTVGSVPLLLVDGPGWLAIALTLPGFGLAPSMIVSALLTERVVDSGGLTRAFALLSSASAVGSAGASALAGRALDSGGTGWGFGIAVGALGAATVVGWSSRRTFDAERVR